MITTLKIASSGLTACAAAILLLSTASAQQNMPQTTKERIKGAGQVTTEQLRGTVDYVEGNDLVVKMADGEVREFHVPESRKFIIDGKELTVHDLKPGTKLTATVTTTTTPVTERTTTVGTGKVWWVAGKTVILTLPNNENRTYTVKDDYKFTINGNKEATVSDLRKGMVVSAQRITEQPHVEIASDTSVVGQAPPPPAPKPVVAQAPPPAPAPAPVQVAQATPPPAPAPAPAPAPVQVAQATPAPTELPTTGSQLPAAALFALFLMGAGLSVRRISRNRNS
jgi:hypothetical protein